MGTARGDDRGSTAVDEPDDHQRDYEERGNDLGLPVVTYQAS